MENEKLRTAMLNAIMRFDEKEKNKKGYNAYALPQYLARLNEVIEDINGGANIRDAIVAGFNGRLANNILKAAGQSVYTEQDARGGNLFYSPTANKQ